MLKNICMAAILAVLWPAFMFSDTPGPQDEPDTLAENFVQAVNSGNLDKLKKLILPESLEKIDDSNQDYYNYIFNSDLKFRIPADFQWSISPLEPRELEALKESFEYPVIPAQLMVVEFDEDSQKSVSIVRQIVQKNNQWYLVLPHPNAEMLAAFRERIKKENDAQKKASQLYLELDGALRLELQVMLDKGQRVEAYKRYSQKAGVEMTIARKVIELLAGSSGMRIPAEFRKDPR